MKCIGKNSIGNLLGKKTALKQAKSYITGVMFFGFFASFNAYSSGCETPTTAYDKTYCSSLEMVQLDQELNDQYKKTLSLLNSEQKKQIKNAQLDWIDRRDTECSEGATLFLKCANDKMKSRISTLKLIERECKNAGCSAETINSKN